MDEKPQGRLGVNRGKGDRKKSMIRVESRPGESFDKTLRRFKKQCEKEGLTKDIKKNSYFEKPSERKRRKIRQAGKAKDKGMRFSRFL
jgi:small subunit ribosomal protein S21